MQSWVEREAQQSVQHPSLSLSFCSVIWDLFLLFLQMILRPLSFPNWAVLKASLSQASASHLGECLLSQWICYRPVYSLFLFFMPSSVFKRSFCCCYYYFLFSFIICLRQDLHYDTLAVPELAMQTSLDSNSHAFTCFCLMLGLMVCTTMLALNSHLQKGFTLHSHIQNPCGADCFY